jgi:hypothetical protein
MTIKSFKDFDGINIFADSDEAEVFVATGPSRETSPEIMRAIVSFSCDLEEAERLWELGPELSKLGSLSEFVHRVTQGGKLDPSNFCWGASGSNWWIA